VFKLKHGGQNQANFSLRRLKIETLLVEALRIKFNPQKYEFRENRHN
jgi:hypothetical protein